MQSTIKFGVKENNMAYLISLDKTYVNANANGGAAVISDLADLGRFGTARVAKVTGNVVNFDVLLNKGSLVPNILGMKFNSCREYKHNTRTFQSKGLKPQTAVTWS